MANNKGGWGDAGVQRAVISFFILFIALGSACFSGETDESNNKPALKSETTVADTRIVQNDASVEDSATDRQSHKNGVELDFSGLNFSEDSGMSPRKCGVLIPKIKY